MTLALALLGTQQSKAENALGIVIGDPTGLSGRFGLDGDHSIEGALAYTSDHYRGMHIHGTYLWDRARTFNVQNSNPIYMYYGIGARIITINSGEHDGDVAIAARAPIGLLFKINNPNLEFFGELAAALNVTPNVDADLDIAIGCRIRF
ncbi:MAG: hypothetical protein J7501_18300 [Bdellovibrio sp.]|nr:hypothetical protein [Bdellovibrio sp.]